MILKGSQRGGSKQLAVHLLKTLDNEHAEVHELLARRREVGNPMMLMLFDALVSASVPALTVTVPRSC